MRKNTGLGGNALIALAHGGQQGSLSTSAKINIVKQQIRWFKATVSRRHFRFHQRRRHQAPPSLISPTATPAKILMPPVIHSITPSNPTTAPVSSPSIPPRASSLAPGKSLDFESKSSYKLNVSASNSSNKTDSATVTINVIDVADQSPNSVVTSS